MAGRSEKYLVRFLAVAGFAGFLGIVNWIAEPQTGTAGETSNPNDPNYVTQRLGTLGLAPAIETQVLSLASALQPSVVSLPAGPIATLVKHDERFIQTFVDALECPPCCGGPDGETPVYADRMIVFVIDSSRNMQPLIGPDYFELAKQGIVNFLSRPGVPQDGSWSVAVIQYAKLAFNSRYYRQGIHWTMPTRLDQNTIDGFITTVANLERTRHFSAGLIDLGILEAHDLFEMADVLELNDPDATRDIILLSTGEYRLPGALADCPPQREDVNECTVDDYVYPKAVDDIIGENRCSDYKAWTDVNPVEKIQGDDSNDMCQRRRSARYAAWLAREGGARISSVHLGPDWHLTALNMPYVVDQALWETTFPYGDPPDYCMGLPAAASRAGLLHEVTNTEADGSPCSSYITQSAGKFARIEPEFAMTAVTSGGFSSTPDTIASTIARWFCEWEWDGNPYPQNHPSNLDNDFFDIIAGETTMPILDICDLCPAIPNPLQRDCDANGIGDLCDPTCEALVDDDLDGVCNSLDICLGGNDCLIAEWLQSIPCEYSGTNADLCGIDCDHNGELDPCQSAIELGTVTLPTTGFDPLNPDLLLMSIDLDRNGRIDACEDGSVDCDPVPDLCDLDAMPNNEYLEAFDWALGDLTLDSIEAKGWSRSTTVPDDAASIITTPYDGQTIQALELGIAADPGTPVDGTFSWFVESPGLDTRGFEEGCHAGQPAIGTCTTPGTGHWSVSALEIDLLIEHAVGGPEFDLFLIDPWARDPGAANRLHLRFRPTSEFTSGGEILTENAYTGQTLGMSSNLFELGRYTPGEWWKLTIVYNRNVEYDYVGSGESACVWSPITTGADRQFALAPLKLPAETSINFGGFQNTKFSSLPGSLPLVGRGTRLRIVSNNKGTVGDRLVIGRILLRESDPCEWRVPDPNDAINYCQEDQNCFCHGYEYTHWGCCNGYCGDGVLQQGGCTIPGNCGDECLEECDPNGVPCGQQGEVCTNDCECVPE